MNGFKTTIAVIGMAASGFAGAVNTCGGYSSTGNPFPCSNGGNCTWWAWKQARDSWGVDFPARGNANTWDTAAADNRNPRSTVPTVGAIAQKESSPYCEQKNAKGVCTRWADYGHVAWVTNVNTSNQTVTVSQMYYGVNGPRTTTHPYSYFDNYISNVAAVQSRDGQNPEVTGCANDAQTVASSTDSAGNALWLRWSPSCQSNWATVVPKSTTAATKVTVTRTSDNRTYSYTGVGRIFTPMVNGANVRVCASGTIAGKALPQACR